jgi:hypothetical protein
MVAKSMIREMLDGMPPGLEEALVLSKVPINICVFYCLRMHYPELLIN